MIQIDGAGSQLRTRTVDSGGLAIQSIYEHL